MTACVVWLTGLPGSGKTTIAERVSQELRRRGHRVEVLDGDAMRRVFPQTGFSKVERDAHVTRAGYLASRLEFHGVIVVASFVSPYREARAAVRALCRTFVEVYVATPLEECERRDVKGMYAKARRGEIPAVHGGQRPLRATGVPRARHRHAGPERGGSGPPSPRGRGRVSGGSIPAGHSTTLNGRLKASAKTVESENSTTIQCSSKPNTPMPPEGVRHRDRLDAGIVGKRRLRGVRRSWCRARRTPAWWPPRSAR